MTSWSPQQDSALKAVDTWLKSKPGVSAPQVFRLFGYAGTGKTTLAREFANDVDGPVMFGAFTGKAAHVMSQKGCNGASTIHSMIYAVEDDGYGEPRFILNRDSDLSTAALVIIDEVSMVGADLARDLLSFKVPVLVLGDPAQLPPVKDAGYFTETEPDVMLTEVHRQAEGSPIIRMATAVRQGEALAVGAFGTSSVLKRADLDRDAVLKVDQVIVGRNRTRHAYNRRIRELNGVNNRLPVEGDRLICLRNDKGKRLLNGSMWVVKKVFKQTGRSKLPNTIKMIVMPDDFGAKPREVEARVREEFFDGTEDQLSWQDTKGTEQFTFGYAITCHKSQGSQWPSVMVFDESAAFRDEANRWLYTAITRAADSLTVVVP